VNECEDDRYDYMAQINAHEVALAEADYAAMSEADRVAQAGADDAVKDVYLPPPPPTKPIEGVGRNGPSTWRRAAMPRQWDYNDWPERRLGEGPEPRPLPPQQGTPPEAFKRIVCPFDVPAAEEALALADHLEELVVQKAHQYEVEYPDVGNRRKTTLVNCAIIDKRMSDVSFHHKLYNI